LELLISFKLLFHANYSLNNFAQNTTATGCKHSKEYLVVFTLAFQLAVLKDFALFY